MMLAEASMINKEIGKIRSVSVGLGGYQDAMIGITFDLGSKSWGVGDFWGTWSMKDTTGCKWSHEQRIEELGETMWRIRELLEAAQVDSVDHLVGKPVEVTLEGNKLISWRILTEAI